MRNASMILFLLIFFTFNSSQTDCVTIEVRNRCPYTVWPAVVGDISTPSNGGFKLETEQFKTFDVPVYWNGTIWVRTWCDKFMNCDTGSCGNFVECAGRSGDPPYTKGQFIIDRAGQDYYYVSLMDGFNVNMAIYPASIEPGDSDTTCAMAGNCNKDIEDFCPKTLRTVVNNRLVSCKSACLAFDTMSYCCRGIYDNSEGCNSKHWPLDYPGTFKKACPKTMTYKYDKTDSMFYCSHTQTHNGSPRKYIVRLC